MGNEKTTSANMQMPIPVAGITTDPYWAGYILQCLGLLDEHDHSSGKGKRLSQASVQVTGNWAMSGYGVSDAKFYAYNNPATITGTIPNASTYFENGDLYIIDGSGNEIQLTASGSLNASLVGGFTGDYATSGAFCRYVSATSRYDFFTPSTTTMANISVGSIEVRSPTIGKHQYGLKLTSSGNIAATYNWTVPDAQGTNVGQIINIDSVGVMSYLDTASFIRTTGDQTKAGILTLSALPVFSATNAPVGSEGVNKTHLSSVISALDKTSVGLSNVDNTADSNKAVASAASLTTPRTINGTSFSGTNNITINPPPHAPSTNTGEFVLNFDGTNYDWVVNTGGSFPEVPNDGDNYVREFNQWNALTLDSINDVAAASPTTGDYLKFDGTNWVPAVVPAADQVSISVTANSNGITAGNVVELVSTGGQNVQNIYHCEAPTIGSLLTLDGTNNCQSFSAASRDSNSVLLAYFDSSNIVCRSVTAGSPPTSSGKLTLAASAFVGPSLSQLSSTEFAAAYRTASSTMVTSVVTCPGTNTPTKSTDSATISVAAGTPATCALTSSNWFVAYADTNSDCQILTAISNATNAPTLGTALNPHGAHDVNYLSLARTSSTTAMLVLQDTTASDGRINHITGGTTNQPTASTVANLDGTNSCTFITQSPIDSNHTLCAYNNTTTSNGCLAVIQANGTNAPTVISRAIFPATVAGDSRTLAQYISLSSHNSNLHSVQWQAGVTGYGHSAEVYVDSNYNLTISAYATLQGTNTVAYNAVAALTPTTAIAAFQGANSDGFAGTLTLTPIPIISGQLVGIASTSATNGATASVDVGPLVTGTYTSGADYYVSGAGGISTNATPIHVLKAKSTTEGVLELRGNPSAGKQQVWEIITPGAFTWTAPEDGEYEIIAVAGGGGGARCSSAIAKATGGNSGNVLQIVTKLKAGSSITGSNGSGGAGASSDDSAGSDGTDSSIVISGVTYSIKGGKRGNFSGAYDTYGNRTNPPNASSFRNILGGIGCAFVYPASFSYGGVVPVLGAFASNGTGAGQVGTNGAGGAGGTTSGGTGGGGCLRISLVHGSGK